jgi:hypothetical protein
MIKRCLQALVLVSTHSTLALAVGSGAEPAAGRPSSEYAAWRSAAAQVLIGRGDPKSLAAAAALSFVGSAAKARADNAAGKMAAVALAARASELDARNPSIGWLRLQLCAGTAGCDIREAAMRLRWVDADNGAVWLPTLAAALKDKNSMEIDRILQDMAQASRFDFYWNRTIVLLFDALRKARKELPAQYLPSDLSRLSESMLIAAAEIVPPLSPLYSACRDPAGAERRDSCLKLARTMQRGDTVGVQLAGFSIAKRLMAPDGKEARTLAERRHVLEWRVASAGRYDSPELPWLGNALARGRIAQMRAARREEDVDVAILRERKLPIEPPEPRS